jgi:hypothetical protein
VTRKSDEAGLGIHELSCGDDLLGTGVCLDGISLNMTLQEAIDRANNLIEWMVEGMADETESEIRKDIDALEVLIRHCKASQKS